MRLGNLTVPCGCDGRREIIFDKGQIGVAEAAILAISVTILVIAWKVNK